MLNWIKKWIYSFVSEWLLRDELFIRNLYAKLDIERQVQWTLRQKALQIRIEEEKRKAAIKLDEQQKANVARKLKETENRQEQCSHLKGGGVRSFHQDYAIWDHTFPDGSRTVRCLLCGKEWAGEQLKSTEVLIMLGNTTNTQSNSEIGPTKKDRTEPKYIGESTPTDFSVEGTIRKTFHKMLSIIKLTRDDKWT